MLGGSAQQVPAIEKAKELGYYTVLIDYLDDCPGQYVADKWYQESTTDVKAVERIARDESVSGILAYASDPAALPAAIVAERLGLPTNPSKSVEILGVKHKFRDFLQDNGFTCPRHFTFSPNDSFKSISDKFTTLNFPIVIKPTDSSGSKGVNFIQSAENVGPAIKNADYYSRNKILIAEEYIERGYPNVIGGDIFVVNGKIVLWGDMDCLRDNNGKSLIPIGKQKPTQLDSIQRQNLKFELQRLIDILHIKNGEMNIEILIDNENKVHFLEVGPRAGGNMIPIQLSDYYSTDLIQANILAAMGEPINLHLTEPTEYFMTSVLHSHQDGIYDGVEISQYAKKYIYRQVLYKKEGDVCEKFDGAGKALGIVFFRFPSCSIMDEIKNSIDENIKIKVKQC